MERCEQCKFWDRTGSRFGNCRRYAPRAAMTREHHIVVWPQTQQTDWCGDFEPSMQRPM